MVQAAQWGWLHSSPKPHKDTRLKMYGGEAIGIERGLDGEYLLDALFTVGPTDYRGGEESPVTWAELLAYGQATGAVSEAWEYEAVMAMSKAYFRAKREGAEGVFVIAPVDRGDG